MLNIKQSDLLREKIQQIQTASLHCHEDNFFGQEAVVAETLEFDDQGILWLCTDKPVQCSGGKESSFDIVLNYHKAGLPFDLDILGDASLVQSFEETDGLPAVSRAFAKGKLVLRVQIIDVDYWERSAPLFRSIVHKLKYMFSHHQVPDSNTEIYPDHQMSA